MKKKFYVIAEDGIYCNQVILEECEDAQEAIDLARKHAEELFRWNEKNKIPKKHINQSTYKVVEIEIYDDKTINDENIFREKQKTISLFKVEEKGHYTQYCYTEDGTQVSYKLR